MRLLTASDPFDLSEQIEALGTAALRRHAAEVAALLGHRSFIVRLAAAEALARAPQAAVSLRARLDEEKNVLVLAEICQSLSLLKDQESLPVLRRLAEHHRSFIVRSYAVSAVADISGRAALPYLEERYRQEHSPAVRGTLSVLRLALGSAPALPDVLKHLRSRTLRIRHRMAVALRHYAPKKGRPALVEALRQAAEREKAAGVRTDLLLVAEELS